MRCLTGIQVLVIPTYEQIAEAFQGGKAKSVSEPLSDKLASAMGLDKPHQEAPEAPERTQGVSQGKTTETAPQEAPEAPQKQEKPSVSSAMEALKKRIAGNTVQ